LVVFLAIGGCPRRIDFRYPGTLLDARAGFSRKFSRLLGRDTCSLVNEEQRQNLSTKKEKRRRRSKNFLID
jgi:hypothetical protein